MSADNHERADVASTNRCEFLQDEAVDKVIAKTRKAVEPKVLSEEEIVSFGINWRNAQVPEVRGHVDRISLQIYALIKQVSQATVKNREE